jgi:hypothetical protein
MLICLLINVSTPIGLFCCLSPINKPSRYGNRKNGDVSGQVSALINWSTNQNVKAYDLFNVTRKDIYIYIATGSCGETEERKIGDKNEEWKSKRNIFK